MFSTEISDQDGEEDEEDPRQRVVTGVGLRVGADREVDEGRAAVGDTGGDRDQADQVEPAGEEAGLGSAQLRGPPVDAARRRVGRHQLGHREPDDQDEHAEDRPGPRDRDRAAVVEAGAEVREAPGQDRDDRERDREVGEARPGPVEVLLVAELGEASFVLAHLRHFSHRATSIGRGPPPQRTLRCPRDTARVYTSAEVARSRNAVPPRGNGLPPVGPGRYCRWPIRSRPELRTPARDRHRVASVPSSPQG